MKAVLPIVGVFAFGALLLTGNIGVLLLLCGVAACLAGLVLGGPSRADREQRRWRLLFALIWPAATLSVVLIAHQQGREADERDRGASRIVGQTRVALLEAGVARNPGEPLAQLNIGGDPARDDIIFPVPQDKDFEQVDLLPQTFVATADAAGVRFVQRQPRDTAGRQVVAFADTRRIRPGTEIVLEESTRIAWRVLREPVRENISLEEFLDLDKRDPNTFDLVAQPDGWLVLRFGQPETLHVERGNIWLASADTRNRRIEREDVAALVTVGARFDASFENTELVLPDDRGSRTLVRGNERQQSFGNSAVMIEHRGFRTLLRVDPLDVDNGLRGTSWWIMGLTVLLSVATSWRARLENPLAAAVLGMAEILLVLRIVLAIEGTILLETARMRQAFPDALLALPLGLLVIHAAVQPLLARSDGPAEAARAAVGKTAVRYALALAAMGVAALMVARAIADAAPEALDGTNKVVVICAVLALAATAARWFLARTERADAPAPSPPPRADEPLGSLPALWNRVLSFPGLGRILAISLAIVLIKLALMVVLGVSERTERFALSTVFIPLTLFAFVPLFLAMLRDRADLARGAVVLLLGLLVIVATHIPVTMLFGAALHLVGLHTGVTFKPDAGLAIVLALTISLVAAVIWSNRAPRHLAASWIVSFIIACAAVRGASEYLTGNGMAALLWLGAAVVGGLIVVVMALSVRGGDDRRVGALAAGALWSMGVSGFAAIVLFTSVPALQPALPSDPASLLDLPSSSTLQVRLTSALASKRIGFLTAGRSEEERDSLADVALYGGTRTGAGYLNVPIAIGVRGQHLSDFAVAVHIVYPFGQFALAGLLLFLASALLIACARLSDRSWMSVLGLLMASTFVVTCFYISLSNLHLAPVTGRNFYLLAPMSHSDLLEGLLLLAATGVLLIDRPRFPREVADAV